MLQSIKIKDLESCTAFEVCFSCILRLFHFMGLYNYVITITWASTEHLNGNLCLQKRPEKCFLNKYIKCYDLKNKAS